MFNEFWAKITGKDKGGRIPEQQAIINRVGNYVIVYPYGMHCDLPDDALIKLIAKDAAISCCIDRPETDQGEIAIFHPVTMSKIIFKNDGSIEMTATDINATADNFNITANMSITGNIDFTGQITSNGKNISDSHAHSGVQAGGGSTGGVI